MISTRYIGTAGWAVPTQHAASFPGIGSGLARYAAVFNAVEINTTFYRSHRPSTFERWGDTVPDHFRFSVKVPKAITHEKQLRDAAADFVAFAASLSGIGDKLGPLLLQLPPKAACDEEAVSTFFRQVREMGQWQVVVEPRHASWFAPEVDELLAGYGVARAGADPERVANALIPGGARSLTYLRLHGSPRIYFDSYSTEYIEALAQSLAIDPARSWCIFDNTASGAAAGDALKMLRASE